MLKLKRWRHKHTGEPLPTTLTVRTEYDFTRPQVLYMLAVHASNVMLSPGNERGYNLSQRQILGVLRDVITEHGWYAIEYQQADVDPEHGELCWQWAREQLVHAWPEDMA